MTNHPRYRVTIYEPAPRPVPAGAQDALAHALGAAARILLDTKTRFVIEAAENGKFYFSEYPEGLCLGEVSPISVSRPMRPKASPTLRARGARPASGWYWWGDRNPDRIPDPPTPPMEMVRNRGYVFGFFTRSHKLLDYAPAKEQRPFSLHRRSTIRDRIVPPNPKDAPSDSYYVIVYEILKHGMSRPILYGLMEDFI